MENLEAERMDDKIEREKGKREEWTKEWRKKGREIRNWIIKSGGWKNPGETLRQLWRNGTFEKSVFDMFTGMRDIWKRELKLKKYAALNKISMYGEHYVM